MGNFCNNCGKALQEGEVCNCTQQQESQMNNQIFGQQQQSQVGYYQQPQQKPIEKKGIPKLLVPISQTAVGGLLALDGLLSLDWAWGEMALLAAAGFLITGICGIIEAKK